MYREFKNIFNMKTLNQKQVILGKFYELKYKFKQSYKYGYGWINPEQNNTIIDIILHEGGVTSQPIENVVFIRQINQ